MSRRSIAALCATVVLAACSADPLDPSAGFEGISVENPLNLPANPPRAEGRRGPNDGTLFDPVSEPIDDGVAFRFSLGHCGLTSPIDVDGSFWDPVDGVTATGSDLDLATDGEMINATSGVVVVIDDEARFRTVSGSVVRLGRHSGDKEFPGCD